MNAQRRKALRAIITKLEELESQRQEIQEELEEVLSQEQEALDNMPESLQESESGQQIADNVENLGYAVDFLQALDVEEITDQLQTVLE